MITQKKNRYRLEPDDLIDFNIRSGNFRVGLVNSDRSLEQALRLRFEVFNMELDEGLNESYATGLDRDRFDHQMDHLVVFEEEIGQIVGTYRIQTGEMARKGLGFYSAQEFDTENFAEQFDRAVELGRACISKEWRQPVVLSLLWQGIEHYTREKNCKWLFGCCSLTSQDLNEGWLAMAELRRSKCIDEQYFLKAKPEHTCQPEPDNLDELAENYKLPKLFRAYMRIGAKVISEPAIDRAFGTIDFLVLCDLDKISFSGFSPLSIANSMISKLIR